MISGSLTLNFGAQQCQCPSYNTPNSSEERPNSSILNSNTSSKAICSSGGHKAHENASQSGLPSIDSNNSSSSSQSGNNGTNLIGYLDQQIDYYENSSDTHFVSLSPFGETNNLTLMSNGSHNDLGVDQILKQPWNYSNQLYNSNLLNNNNNNTVDCIANQKNLPGPNGEECHTFQQSLENILLCDIMTSNEIGLANDNSVHFHPNSILPFLANSETIPQHEVSSSGNTGHSEPVPPNGTSNNNPCRDNHAEAYSRINPNPQDMILYQMNKEFESSTDVPFTSAYQGTNGYSANNVNSAFSLINELDASQLGNTYHQNYQQTSLLNSLRISTNGNVEDHQSNMEKQQYSIDNYPQIHHETCQSSIFLSTNVPAAASNSLPSTPTSSTSTLRSYTHRADKQADAKASKGRVETIQERDKRVRNNEASRRSRAAKKIRVEAIITETECLNIENHRLKLLLDDILLAICDSKELLIKNYKQQ